MFVLATGAGDDVVHNVQPEKEPVSARKQWGGPAGTALNVLKQADLRDTGKAGSTLSPINHHLFYQNSIKIVF